MMLARSGAALIFDNVVRGGEVVRADSSDAKVPGTRALYDALHAHPQMDATAIQTVGAKGWDGVRAGGGAVTEGLGAVPPVRAFA